MIIVMMGVAGSGKTHVGRELAARLGWSFFDADDFHSPENIARMRGGMPLSDEHRQPWLRALRELLIGVHANGGNAVLACSALRSRFRDQLREDIDDLHFVHLHAAGELIAKRLLMRADHFMSPALAESQYAALEEPLDALVLDASEPAPELVQKIRIAFGV